jgi:hypothetical protein
MSQGPTILGLGRLHLDCFAGVVSTGVFCLAFWLTHTVGGRWLHFNDGWSFFQPLRGGRRFFFAQLFAWTSYAFFAALHYAHLQPRISALLARDGPGCGFDATVELDQANWTDSFCDVVKGNFGCATARMPPPEAGTLSGIAELYAKAPGLAAAAGAAAEFFMILSLLTFRGDESVCASDRAGGESLFSPSWVSRRKRRRWTAVPSIGSRQNSSRTMTAAGIPLPRLEEADLASLEKTIVDKVGEPHRNRSPSLVQRSANVILQSTTNVDGGSFQPTTTMRSAEACLAPLRAERAMSPGPAPSPDGASARLRSYAAARLVQIIPRALRGGLNALLILAMVKPEAIIFLTAFALPTWALLCVCLLYCTTFVGDPAVSGRRTAEWHAELPMFFFFFFFLLLLLLLLFVVDAGLHQVWSDAVVAVAVVARLLLFLLHSKTHPHCSPICHSHASLRVTLPYG